MEANWTGKTECANTPVTLPEGESICHCFERCDYNSFSTDFLELRLGWQRGKGKALNLIAIDERFKFVVLDISAL